jgi:hypothetical protein
VEGVLCVERRVTQGSEEMVGRISTHAKEIVRAAPLALGRLWLLALRTSQKLLCRCLLRESQGGGCINFAQHHEVTAYIERLNATFRQRLACLARRSTR